MAKSPDGKWLAYIRVRDQNFLVNSIQLKVWKSEDNMGFSYHLLEKEKILLEYLQNNDSISLEDFCEKASINRKKLRTFCSGLY